VAHFRAEVGPCDDEGYLYKDGILLLQTKLFQSKDIDIDLPDGSYNFRFIVKNNNWAWQAMLRLVINGDVIADVDQTGGTGLDARTVYDQIWTVKVRDGRRV